VDDFVPYPHRRSREARERYLETSEEVPGGLLQTLLGYVDDFLMARYGGQPRVNATVLQRVEQVLNVDLDWSRGEWQAKENLLDLMASHADLLLGGVDYALRFQIVGADGTLPNGAQKISDALARARSSLVVSVDSQRTPYLAQRVDPMATAAAREATAPEDEASRLLLDAWNAQYARTGPDPSGAYHNAVLALEAVAGPLVLPKDKTRTLGKIIANLKQAEAKWLFVLDGTANPVTSFRGMLEAVWETHVRHAPTDPSQPSSVTAEQSEAALHMAIAAVQLLRRRAIHEKT
jgi:hypothetical protein